MTRVQYPASGGDGGFAAYESLAGQRYARWLTTYHRWILGAALLIAGLGAWQSSRLELRAELANLLPPSRQSVRDLELIKQRIRALGALWVVVEAPDPVTREAAIRALHTRLQGLDPALLANLAYDDAPVRRYLWEHRFLLVGLEELVDARDALSDRIRQAKLDANPLFVDLGDDDDDDSAGDGEPTAADSAHDTRLASLMKRIDEAEARANAPGGFVSRNGRYQLLVLRATFTAPEIDKSKKLYDQVMGAVRATRAELGPGVQMGLVGDIPAIVVENRSIFRGMVIAAVVTVLIVTLALLLYYRSWFSVMALLWALTVGCVATFGVTQLVIGHLNLATAFLAAIVVGNGINPGLMLMARYFEELRAGTAGSERLGNAIIGATRGTLAASLTAGVAYASLIVTDFRGFRHFGIIGGVGMVLCWLSAFTVLPAALVALDRHLGRRLRRHLRPQTEPSIGRMLAALLPANLRAVVVFSVLATMLCGYMTWRYLAGNPLEHNWHKLRSTGTSSLELRRWEELVKSEFDQNFNSNLSTRFAIALPTRAMVAPVVARMRAVDQGKDSKDKLFLYLYTYNELVPGDQAEKIALLAQIRDLTGSDFAAELTAEDRALMARLRPPEHIRPITDADVPDELAWPFIETDGSRGRIILSATGLGFDPWNVRHLVAFSQRVRALGLPEEARIGGQVFVSADMLESMEHDGPKATLVALLGSILAVWLVIGLGRHGLVTLSCAASGTLAMIAIVASIGIKINFLDFIALPITIGIGIDYAVNIAARERQDGYRGPRSLLTTTGGAVFLCSFTTTVGYGSLLLSENAGIRSFGLAAIVGEITCMIAALALAPALLCLLRGGSASRSLR